MDSKLKKPLCPNVTAWNPLTLITEAIKNFRQKDGVNPATVESEHTVGSQWELRPRK